MASSSSSNSPCAACKFLRRKCMPGCIFAPYFPPEEPHKFANVHKIFGASNVTKILNVLLPHQREDAVNSLAHEAEARLKDPVYGCVGAISVLQRQVQRLQKQLDAANADLRYSCCHIRTGLPVLPSQVNSTGPYPRTVFGRDALLLPSVLPDPLYSFQWTANNTPGDGNFSGEIDQRDGGEDSM